MTTRGDRAIHQGLREEDRRKWGTTPRLGNLRYRPGLTNGITINTETHRLAQRVEGELARIGRFHDAEGFYKDGVISDQSGDLIVPDDTSGVSTVLDKDTTETDIVNTTTLTTIYDGTIPAASMGISGYVELLMYSDYLNNSGAVKGLQFQVSLGGTVYMDYTSDAALGVSATRRVNVMCISIMNLGTDATNLMRMNFQQSTVNTTGTTTTGLGGYWTVEYSPFGFNLGTLPITEDSSADLALTVKVAHSAAHASLSFRQEYSVLRRTA